MEVVQSESTEDVEAWRRAVIKAGVKAVLVIRSGAGANEVVGHTGCSWGGEEGENRRSRWRDPANGNTVRGKRGPAGSIQGVSSGGIVDLTRTVDVGVAKIFA